MVLHYAQLAARRRRRRCVPDRLGIAGADARALRLAASIRRSTRLVDAGRRREGDRRRRHDRHLWRRLDRIRRACRRRGATKCAFRSIRCGRRRAIDVVGIDYYAPLADWRDERRASRSRARELDLRLGYLAGNLRGGEGYDWYYADDAARAAQTRTPITDGLGKPWIFRVKDIWNWWAIRITSASAAPSLARRPAGCRRASRSGSPRSAAPRSTRAPTSRACFPIRNRRNPACRISPTARATT